MRHLPRKRHGLTLLEVVASTFLVSTLLIVSLNATANLRRGHASELESAIASRWLDVFADEISSTAFTDQTTPGNFGIESNEDAADRTTLDDCDDYHGQSLLSPTRRDGSAIDDLTGWTLSFAVTALDATATGATVAASNDSHLRKIQITLLSTSGQSFTTSVLLSDTDTNQPEGETSVSWNEVELTSSAGRTLRTQAPNRNLPVTP